MPTPIQIKLRPFCEEDRAVISEIENRDMPVHHRWTDAQWAHNDSQRSPSEVFLRLVAADPVTDHPIGFLDVTDRSTSPRRKEGVCAMELMVAHARRRQGIGQTLYERALEFTRERQAKRLTTMFMEFGADDPTVRFLKTRSFTELDRVQASSLDVTAFDPAPFAGALARAAQAGISLFAYADIADNEENRRKLYALAMPIQRDMPTHDTAERTDLPFEDWIKRFERPNWSPATQIIAEKEGRWIGLTALGIDPETQIGQTWATGVLKEERGQGVATALKVHVIQIAQARGCTVIATDNHEDNGPMLAINHKLGFQPDLPFVSYNKDLTETTVGENS